MFLQPILTMPVAEDCSTFSWCSLPFSRRLALFYKCLSDHALTPSRIYLVQTIYYIGTVVWQHGLLCAIVYGLNRLARVPGWVAGNAFLLGIMVLFAFFDTPVQLVNGRSTIIFVIPVFMAAFLLGPGGSLIYSLLVTLELLILTWAGNLFQSGAVNFIPMVILIISGFIALVSGRNTERSIRETRRLSSQRAAILQGISDGIILLDPEGKIIVHNSSASRILNKRLDNCSIKELLRRSRRPGKCRQNLTLSGPAAPDKSVSR